jgi:hypothetical protein
MFWAISHMSSLRMVSRKFINGFSKIGVIYRKVLNFKIGV